LAISIAVADPREMIFLLGPAIDRHPLAERVVVADFQNRCRVEKAEVLRLGADDGVGPESIPRTDSRLAENRHVAVEYAAVAELHGGTDAAERPDLNVSAQFRPGIHVRQRGNARRHDGFLSISSVLSGSNAIAGKL
jgi:hypothetical protein